MRRHVIRALDHSPRVRDALLASERARLTARLEVLYRVQHRPAVIVFQMGKVGSSSVTASFPTARYPVAIQTHHLHRPQIEAMKELQRSRGLPVRKHYAHAEVAARRVIEANRPYRLITLVREPISQSVSHFFQAFESFVGTPFEQSTHSIEELQEIFVASHARLNRSYWFDREFAPALGVDVYEHPFPHDIGHQRIPAGRGEILILRLELDDDVKQRAIAEFLDEPDFRLRTANTGETKEYAQTYRAFKAELVLPERYVERMHDTRHAHHFYSDAELAAARARWLQPPPA